MPVISEWDLRLDTDAVLRGQGADPAILRRRNPRLAELALQALEEGLPLVQPRVLFERFTLESIHHNLIRLAGGDSLQGDLPAHHLVQTSEIIVSVCTIGAELETLASRMMHTQPGYGFALYGVGSAAVEALANAACRYFESQAKDCGLASTIPISPGMTGWSVEQGQPQIFSLLDSSQIGVVLTGQNFMVPQKSLSMVIGLGVDLEQKGKVCDYCGNRMVCKYQNRVN